MLGASVVILATCGFLLWRRQRISNQKTKAAQSSERCTTTSPPLAGALLAEALKEELLQLEIDRSHGAVTGKQYASARQALEETVKRALARARTG